MTIGIAMMLVGVVIATGMISASTVDYTLVSPTPVVASEQDPPAIPKIRNDRLVDIGNKVPGFGGMRLSPIDPAVLNVFLLNPEDEEQIDAVRDAISESFPGAIPPGGIQAVQGQYRILDLYQ